MDAVFSVGSSFKRRELFQPGFMFVKRRKLTRLKS